MKSFRVIINVIKFNTTNNIKFPVISEVVILQEELHIISIIEAFFEFYTSI